MRSKNRLIGAQAEQAATEYLTKKGHVIIIRNFRTKYGDIDIISQHRGCIVFTEVKFRLSDRLGCGLSAVTPNKQKKLSLAALEYIAAHKLFDIDARFDVISMQLERGHIQFDHVENAFDLAFP